MHDIAPDTINLKADRLSCNLQRSPMPLSQRFLFLFSSHSRNPARHKQFCVCKRVCRLQEKCSHCASLCRLKQDWTTVHSEQFEEGYASMAMLLFIGRQGVWSKTWQTSVKPVLLFWTRFCPMLWSGRGLLWISLSLLAGDVAVGFGWLGSVVSSQKVMRQAQIRYRYVKGTADGLAALQIRECRQHVT